MKNESMFQDFWLKYAVALEGLFTTEGEEVKVISTGIGNHDQGPDFKNAFIKIGGTEWFGNIELHLRTSDWFRHFHDKDPQYQNIILHVVWIHDHNRFNICPVVELSSLLSWDRFQNYHFDDSYKLPCANGIMKTIDQEKNFFEQLVIRRYERKIEKINELIRENKGNVEQVGWEVLARNFGYKVNADCFEKLAKAISFAIVRKYSKDSISLEALFLGISGLLPPKPNDPYIRLLADRFSNLQWEHNLIAIHDRPVFLRMRPINFPTIRLVQLASICSGHTDIFDLLLSCKTIEDLKEFFIIQVNSYWLDHYIPDKPAKHVSKKVGDQLILSVILNVLIPLQLTIKKRKGCGDWKTIALDWLKTIKPEHSHIIQLYRDAGFIPANGFESQGLLELYQNKCIREDCMDCLFAK